jgi:hypothetical protein
MSKNTNDYFKYYGFYGRKGNTDEVNDRTKYRYPSTDPYINNKEFGIYVHTFDDKIINHLDIEYNKSGKWGQHYGNIENLIFQPVEDLSEETIKIQDLINICYGFYIDESGKYVSWAKIHALAREYMYSGYNSELSKNIVDLYAEKAEKELNNNFFNKILDDQIKPILKQQSARKCDKLHEINTRLPNNNLNKPVKRLILEDYLYIAGKEKQLLLGDKEIWEYENNPIIFNDPWLFRWSKLGFLVWNLMINKASIKCILDHNPALFPIQIILNTNPNYLFFEQINIEKENIEKENTENEYINKILKLSSEQIKELSKFKFDINEIKELLSKQTENENIEYIGYFICRIKYDKIIIADSKKDSNCNRLYEYENDRGPNTLDQYNFIIIFVFKKSYWIWNKEKKEYELDEKKNNSLLITEKYILTDFRLQRIHWGNVTRSKRVLFIEIQQLMCSLLNTEYSFYFLSEYIDGQNLSITSICRTQYQQINKIADNKKENNKCYEAWLHNSTYEILNYLNIKLKGESYNILISKKKIDDLLLELNERNENKNDEIIFTKSSYDNFDYININLYDKKKYILFPCHFKWETITNKDNITINNNKYGNKKIFVIKHGYLNLKQNIDKQSNEYYDSIEYYKNELCLEGNCIFDRDYIANTFNHINIFNDNIPIIPDNYFQVLNELQEKLNLNENTVNKNIKLIYENLINKLEKNKYIDFFYNEINKYNEIKKHIDTLKDIITELPTNINYKEKITNISELIEHISNIFKKKVNIKEQTGGFEQINKVYKIIKKINLYKQNFKSIILSNPSLYLNNIYKNIGFNISHVLDDYSIKKYSNEPTYIKNYLHVSINIINNIIDGDILIISDNINMLLLCDKYLDIKINYIILVLVDININNLKMLNLFKFKNKIKILCFGKILNNELIINIIKYFNNIKFNNIIIDFVDDNNQVFYNILGIKICKELLINNGSYIQFSKIPNIEYNIIFLYYIIYKCFKYNVFESHTSFIFKNSMYNLIYHKYFEYNLNYEEENIINKLLSDNKTKLNNNIIFDTLFIDFLNIKYLTIYYNLQNSAQKIFKISYNILENKNIEQQGGYQITKNTSINLYEAKYTCTYLEKQLFLLHLNCLTKVYLYENKNLDNFYIYYDNDGYGFYQETLQNMFKQLTWTNKYDKTKECIYISNNLDMYHKIKPKYALMDFKPDTDNNNYFDGEVLYTLYPFSNTNFKVLVKEYNKIKEYSDNIFQELLNNNKLLNLCYNYDFYNINKVIPIRYLKLIPGYTDNFECILEYKILYNYFYRVHNNTDHKIIINKLFDINIDNKNNIKHWLNCTLKKFQNSSTDIDVMFKKIIQLNIEQHAQHQIQLLKDYGLEVLDKHKINKAIEILEKYASDKVYIQIL